MSYIYEALLRAERERQSTPPTAEERRPDPQEEFSAGPRIEEIPAAPPEIPLYSWNPFVPSFPTLAKHGRALEQFRSLRSHIYQARNETPLKTILISSGMPSEGKSFVAANLAVSLARNSNNRILLIDGDLRRPSLNHMLGAPNEIGLSDFLTGSAELHAVMQRSKASDANGNNDLQDFANVTFIPTGSPHENASELINNQRIKDLIARVSNSFDWILIDSPPALVFADAVDLARAADAVLLVVRGAQTTYDVAQRAKSSFVNSRILGVVLNDIKNPPRRESYYNSYYYGYGYGKRETAADSASKAKQEKE
ncbi:MAG: CpsD/CapB family tyrosine-protein kinase [Terracidiphilus sp.]